MHIDIKKILQPIASPKAILVGISIGVLAGLFAKPLVPYISPFGEMYRSLLMMCILPIIFTSIILGLVRVFRVGGAEKKLGKLALVFFGGSLLVATMSMGTTFALRDVLHLSSHDQNVLAEAHKGANIEDYPAPSAVTAASASEEKISVGNREQSQSQNQSQNQSQSQGQDENTAEKIGDDKVSYLLKQFIPSNIFTAFNEGLSMKIVILALLMGISLGRVKNEYTGYFLDAIDVLHEVFHKIFDWVLLLAPFGLMGIFTEIVSGLDAQMFKALLSLAAIIYLLGSVLLGVHCTIICLRLKVSIFELLQRLKRPLLLGFATLDPVVALPASVDAFATFKMNKKLLELILSLGMTLNRQHNVVLFALVSMFSLMFYGIPLSFEKVFLVLLLSSILGACAYGNPAAYMPMFLVLAKIVGMPAVMGSTILLACELFGEWMEITLILFSNYTAVALVAESDVAANSVGDAVAVSSDNTANAVDNDDA